MTAIEVINELKKYPENMDVFIDERISDFTYGLLNSVVAKEINLSEEPGGEPIARDKVIILSEQ